MNYLATVKKHMEKVEESYGRIVTEGTREKARGVIRNGMARMGIGEVYVRMGESVEFCEPGKALTENVVPSVITAIPDGVGGADVCGEGRSGETEPRGVESKETAFYKGNPVLTPVSDHEVEGGAVEVVEEQKVEEIGGWPVGGVIEIIGLSPNRRMLRGKIGGRVVSVERKPGIQPGIMVKGRLVRAGASPLYRVI